MSIKGRPYTWLLDSLDRGDLGGTLAAASEVERVPLDVALRILALIAEKQPQRYEPAAVRWLGRLLLEELLVQGLWLRMGERLNATHHAMLLQPGFEQFGLDPVYVASASGERICVCARCKIVFPPPGRTTTGTQCPRCNATRGNDPLPFWPVPDREALVFPPRPSGKGWSCRTERPCDWCGEPYEVTPGSSDHRHCKQHRQRAWQHDQKIDAGPTPREIKLAEAEARPGTPHAEAGRVPPRGARRLIR